MVTGTLLTYALAAREATLSVVPPRADGSKRPISTWKKFQHSLPSPAQIDQWYANECTGIGYVTGAVSGNLELFEFDDPATYEAFKRAADAVNLGALLQRIEAGYFEQTPNGLHLLYRCTAIAGNTKLACRPKRPEERAHIGDKIKVLIETRGEGGYMVAAPSHGAVHPSGRPYVLVSGGVATIVTITPEERQALWDLARTFHQPSRVEAGPSGDAGGSDSTGLRPGDDFNRRATWREILAPAGWTEVAHHDSATYWRRPGKTDGWSASTNHAGSDLFYCWSTSTPFDAERGYAKFAVYTLLHQQGDFAAAAKALGAEGYGDPLPASARVRLGGALGRDAAQPGQGVAPPSYATTDAGNGEYFAFLQGDRLRYDHARKRWLVWTGHWWTPDADAEVRRLAKDTARQRYVDALQIEDLKERAAEAKWAVGMEARSRLDSMLLLAQSERPIADDGTGWDADPWLLGVANGIVDLRTGSLRAGRPEDRLTLHTTVAYDPAATCPRWERFLAEVFAGDQALISFIQRAVGYSLSGLTVEQVLFMCFGSGANGKSTFLRVVRAVLGDYAHNVAFSTLELSARSGIPHDLANLVGRRFISASETSELARLNEARIKALTGEDPLTARRLYESEFTFQPVGKFWLSVNHRPQVRDDSVGYWRRIREIPFTQCFRDDQCDPHLFATLQGEAAGILAWAVRGCLAWQREGLGPPEVVQQATAEYQRESDPVVGFLEDCCVQVPNAYTRSSALFQAYRTWAAEQGYKERDLLNTITFGRRMVERFGKPAHGRGGNGYRGVGLLAQDGERLLELGDTGSATQAAACEGSAEGPSSSREGLGGHLDNFPLSPSSRKEFPDEGPSSFTSLPATALPTELKRRTARV